MHEMKKLILPLIIIFLLPVMACNNTSGPSGDHYADLPESFQNPPESSKPWTWWHWIDGNITMEGISHDLEAMSRAGLGAALIFNVKLGLPDGPVRFMTDEWQSMLEHAARECDRLGMKLGIHNCDGWSQAGGPWITPEQSMKKLTWSKEVVKGPVAFSSVLPRPPVPESPLVKDFYRDIAVLAYPTPSGERVNGPGSGISAKGSISGAELQKLFDGNSETHAGFPLGTQENPLGHEIIMQFGQRVSAGSLVIHGIEGFRLSQVIPAKLEVSDKGGEFRLAGSFELNWSFEGSPHHTISVSFPEVTGDVYRLSFRGEYLFSTELTITELELSTKPLLHYWEAKVGWARYREHGGEAPYLYRDPGPSYGTADLPDAEIPLDRVQIFRGALGEDGLFEWDVPEGDWTIVRMGYTSTGRTNSPATDEGRGLEADKLDAEAVKFHMSQFIGKLAQQYKGKDLESFKVFETDSWESGIQIWTKDLDKRFLETTGQDLLRWLPLITDGVMLDGYEESDRFLWDWRRFLADEIAESYFRVTRDFAEKEGLIYVAESSGRQMFMYDPIGYQRISPVPMGEFWVSPDRGQGVRVDNRVAASAAHLSGAMWVASESYTSSPEYCQWTQHPFTLKALGDKAYCEGVNKFVFHTYAHQPYPELKPGFTMGRWGMHNHSGNTWWNGPVEAWFKYQARCQHMLQEGRFHADILAYHGDEIPARLGRREEFIPSIPDSYDFDGCDFQALLDARIEKGVIVMPSGMRYRVLLLPDKNRIPLAVAERIVELLDEGAIIISPSRPAGTPSLTEMGEEDGKVRELVEAYWAASGTDPESLSGKVIPAGDDLGVLLGKLGIQPDFHYTSDVNAEIRFIHRIIGDFNTYFLSNQREEYVDIKAIFRQDAERYVTLWDPANGKISIPRNVDRSSAGRITADLELAPYESVFVVFSNSEVNHEPLLEVKEEKILDNAWKLKFDEGLGGPAQAVDMDELWDWTQSEDFSIRHYSGTGSYTATINIPEQDLADGGHVLLDLGVVKEIAEVRLNGQAVETLWKPPFQVDITSFLKPGDNKLDIRVTNLWVNRLVGDAYFKEEMKWRDAGGTMTADEWPEWIVNGDPRPESERIAWSTRKIYSKEDPLLPSGLLGPVMLLNSE